VSMLAFDVFLLSSIITCIMDSIHLSKTPKLPVCMYFFGVVCT
jgi:hypothetical protein